MPEGTYELVQPPDGVIARIHSRGSAVLGHPDRSTAAPRSPWRSGGRWG